MRSPQVCWLQLEAPSDHYSLCSGYRAHTVHRVAFCASLAPTEKIEEHCLAQQISTVSGSQSHTCANLPKPAAGIMISEDRKTAAGLEVVIVDLGEQGLPHHYAAFRDPCHWHTALAYPVLAA